MKYQEITIITHREKLDPLTCILMDMGIVGFVVNDPMDVENLLARKDELLWDYVSDEVIAQKNEDPKVTFYLDIDEEVTEILNALEEYKPICKIVDDEDWKDNWKEYFKPANITPRIVVKPTWETYEKKDEELILEIDPGMAFGTGTHPTTCLCVQLMEKYMEPSDIILDVGCGSGILSIAARLLGAEHILGVDIDPIAVEVSKENILLNNMEDIDIRYGDLTKGLNVKADIVVANLMADLVVMLSQDVKKHLQGKSLFISSGILIEKQTMVKEALEKVGFEIVEVKEQGEWCAICAKAMA